MRKAYGILDYLVSIIDALRTYFSASVLLISMGILVLFQNNELEICERQQEIFLNLNAAIFALLIVMEILRCVLSICNMSIYPYYKYLARITTIIVCYLVYNKYGIKNVAVYSSINMKYVFIFAIGVLVLQYILQNVKGKIWKRIQSTETESIGTACMVNETKVDEEGKTTDSESE